MPGKSAIDRYRTALDKVATQHQEARSAIVAEKKCLKKTRTKITAIGEAIQIAQITAQKLQTIAHERISGIVSQCLSDIFMEPVEFKIIWDKKRGKTEGRMVFIQNGNEVDPQSSDGGSALEIAAFALRLANIVISSEDKRRLLIKDEPFLALSEKHAARVQEMIMVLSKELEMQFLIITHNKKLRSGKLVDISE